LLWSSVAVADDKSDIGKLLKSHYATPGSTMDHPSISEMSRHLPDEYQGGLVSPLLNRVGWGAKVKVGTPEIVFLDKTTAWFHVSIAISIEGNKKEDRTARANGIVHKADGNWRVDGELIAMTVSDTALVEDAKKATPLAVPKTPAVDKGVDQALATAVTGWITDGGLAKGASASTKTIASGTALGEHKTGAAAGKLAADWDTLKMKPIEISAKLYSPNHAFVIAKVALPAGKQKVPVGMLLGAVLVKEKDGWRWQSLNWAPVVWNPLPENVGEKLTRP
jgi:hypothetical protein